MHLFKFRFAARAASAACCWPSTLINALLPLPAMLHLLCMQAINKINPSVAQKDVKRHEEWLKVYGSI